MCRAFSGMFALDDYGSGYNGEAMLLAVQPDYVKIDVAIVRGVDQDDDKRQLVEKSGCPTPHVRGIALVGEGRYADAVRLIRKDNPFPTTCGFICEHPCEARCRRNMVDDSINIRGTETSGSRLCRRGGSAGMCAVYRQKDSGSWRRTWRIECRLLPAADGTSGSCI
mgnify:CR=1 FL=1